MSPPAPPQGRAEARAERLSADTAHDIEPSALPAEMNTPATAPSYPQVQAQLVAEPKGTDTPFPLAEGHDHSVVGKVVEASAARRALKAQREEEAHVDLELVKRAQAGDDLAFRKLVERHQRRAFAIALSLVRHEQDARDIVQDAFLRVHKSLGSFQGGSSFFTWLYRIVTNLAIDLVRRPGRNTEGIEEDRGPLSNPGAEPDPMWVSRIDGADPVDVLRRKELAARMRTAIDALPSYHKAVILMREVEGLSYEEMAEAMQVSKGTIMSRLFHARQKLQKALADCYEEEQEK
jgi:RNA polymerase sigma-70 factor, ECF subfamily